MVLIILIILLALYAVFLIGKKRIERQVGATINELQASCADLSAKKYREEQISDLPEPVQRYFKYALEDGQSYIGSVVLKHNGQFKTALDKEWINIEGEQFFSADEPGFLWKGETALFSVRDQYVAGRGKITVTLLNLFRVVEGEGPEYDQGELLRWLGESVWYPTNLLPRPGLSWSPINDNSAELSFNYHEQVLSYKISFGANGEIVQLETKRYMGDEGLYTWIGRVSNYKKINGMKIPMWIEAYWLLDDGEHCYARFNVKEIKHN